MRIVKLSAISVSVALSLWSTTALAEASNEGAADLLAVLQTYLGTTEGVVAVAVDGDAYAVTIDPGILMAAGGAEGFSGSVSPLNYLVTDNGDGTWAYEMDQPVTLDYALAEQMSAKTTYGQVVMSGTFDEALGDVSEYHVEINDVVSEQTQKDLTGEAVIKMTQSGMIWDGKGEAGDNGVNSTFTMTSGEMVYDMAMPAGEGMPPMQITATVAEGSADGAITGYQPAGIYGLLAYFVAHPSEALIKGDMPGLKAATEAALPLFQNLTMTGAYTGVEVTTMMGGATINEVGVTVDMNGVVADGKFREAFDLKGLKLTDSLLPPEIMGLIPSDLSIDFTASGFDLAAAAVLGLGAMDLPVDAPMPNGFDAEMMAAIMPKGTVDITIAPGATTAAAYKLTYEGAMAVGPATPMPVGKARLGLTGIDQINAALMASPPEMGLQDMAPMLAMAQMMAQPGVDGELVWEIETTATGGLLVNGQDMMGGGQ